MVKNDLSSVEIATTGGYWGTKTGQISPVFNHSRGAAMSPITY